MQKSTQAVVNIRFILNCKQTRSF